MGKDKNMAAKNAKVRKFDLAAGKERAAIKVIDGGRPVTRITDIVRDYYAIPYYDEECGEYGLRDYKDTLEVIPWVPSHVNPCYDHDIFITHPRMYMRGYEGWVSQWDDYGNPKWRVQIKSLSGHEKKLIAHGKRAAYSCITHEVSVHFGFSMFNVWKWGHKLTCDEIRKEFGVKLISEGERFYNDNEEEI